MDTDERIIYSLNVQDLRLVAEDSLGRSLSDDEIKLVEDNLGDYIQWYDIIEAVIENHIVSTKSQRRRNEP